MNLKFRSRLTAILFISLTGLTGAIACSPPVPAKKGTYAVINTDKGALVLRLYTEAAPKTVANFVKLARKGYYDGIKFHRVIPGFMAQTGDPQGTGAGGPGYKFADEMNADALGLDKIKFNQWQYRTGLNQKIFRALLQKHRVTSREQYQRLSGKIRGEFERKTKNITVKEGLEMAGYVFTPGLPSKPPVKGSVAMANAGPNTNGSQFFINQVDTPHLIGMHTVFGELVTGTEVLNEIIKAGNHKSLMKSVKIVERK